ncbi:hypothetical protein M422DRAFT_257136 [Sphaerobolus stellatus SS14]|uniref:Tc1-like transposase DDE domain-containing protein n=1 Tax=Sphaerobolus stellatus (strain SS14) TaxID=990650 RepID=A0A0C9UAB1_SPHS4|nr:hypothetical protein M422DRAFT_257136 [Sphaerobolus stellatus SS14]
MGRIKGKKRSARARVKKQHGTPEIKLRKDSGSEYNPSDDEYDSESMASRDGMANSQSGEEEMTVEQESVMEVVIEASEDELEPLGGLVQLYPLFFSENWKKETEPRKRKLSAGSEPISKKKKGTYNKGSRTTQWRRDKHAKANASDIRDYFRKEKGRRAPSPEENLDITAISDDNEILEHSPESVEINSMFDIREEGLVEQGEQNNETGPPDALNAMLTLLEENFSKLKISIPESRPDLQRQLQSSQHGLVEELKSSPQPPDVSSIHTTPEEGGTTAMDVEETSYSELDRILRDLLKKAQKSKITDVKTMLDLAVLSDYNLLRENLRRQGVAQPDLIASLRIAECKPAIRRQGEKLTKAPWFARQLRAKAAHVLRFGCLPESTQGKAALHHSLLNDEGLFSAVRIYLASLDIGEVTPISFHKHINEALLPSFGISKEVTLRTAERWLNKLGYKPRKHRKGVYMDGHERKDVVEYRNKFLERMAELERVMVTYNDKTGEPIQPILRPGEKVHHLIAHDESGFHANDQQSTGWLSEGQQDLHRKGRGRLLHVSDFVIEATGRLSLTPKQLFEQSHLPEAKRLKVTDARKIIYPGKNHDTYWNMKQLMEQLDDALKIYNVMFPDTVGNMNVSPGGKQSILRDTEIPMDNPHPHLRGVRQSMVFPPDHPKYPNQAKGMEEVLKERGLWNLLVDIRGGKKPLGKCETCSLSEAKREKAEREAKARMEDNPETFNSAEDARLDIDDLDTEDSERDSHCCMTRCLAEQADFRNEKPLLQIEIEKAGHICLFLPKFHCELNPIERYWGYTKRLFRASCNGSFPHAKKLLPECLDSCTTETIRHFFRKCWRYMSAYRNGLSGKQAEFAVKKYKSHRRIPDEVDI